MSQSDASQAITGPARLADLDSIMLRNARVGFAVKNLNPGADGGTVYLSVDPHWGKLSVTMQNNTEGPITLYPPGSSPKPSLLKVYLSPLLASTDVAAIEVKQNGFTGSPVQDDQGYHLELQPAQKIVVQPTGQVTIELDNVLAASSEDQAAAGYFRFEYSNFEGTPDDGRRLPIFVENLPTATNPWPVQFSFVPRSEYGEGDQGNTVYVTPWQVPGDAPAIENEFVLQITNSNLDPIPMPATGTPAVSFLFLTGDTSGCICREEQIGYAYAGWQGDPNYHWEVDKKGEAIAPIWILAPQAGAANTNFLGGTGGAVAVQFTDLWTDLPPNDAALMLVGYSGLSGVGFNDGHQMFVIYKQSPQPSITAFEASYVAWTAGSPTAPPASSGQVAAGSTIPYGTVTATWNVFAAKTATLTVEPPVPGQPFTVPTAGNMAIPLPAPFLDDVFYTYTLEAYVDPTNPNSSNSRSEPFSFTMSAAPAPQATMICWGYHLAQADTAYDSRVQWSTIYATSCQVLDGGGQSVSSALSGQADSPNNGSFQISASGPGGGTQPSTGSV